MQRRQAVRQAGTRQLDARRRAAAVVLAVLAGPPAFAVGGADLHAGDAGSTRSVAGFTWQRPQHGSA